MTAALVDNGSLEPAAHRNLRKLAAAVGERAGVPVAPVSWKHSDRIPAAALDGEKAWTLDPWVRDQIARGEREFVIVPFFVSPQGAIGSALREDLERLRPSQAEDRHALRRNEGLASPLNHAMAGGEGQSASPRGERAFNFRTTASLEESLSSLVVDRIAETIAAGGLRRPAVIVVDHGGPSSASADVRDAVAAEAREALGGAIRSLSAASMESPDGPAFAFNQPLFADLIGDSSFAVGDIVVAPLFLAPGRHAGPDGDLARAARAAESLRAGCRIRFTDLLGTHPRVPEILSMRLRSADPAYRLGCACTHAMNEEIS